MTAKNKTENSESETPVKATTGAWWKSTVAAQEESVAAAAGTEAATVKEKKPSRAPRRGRKDSASKEDAGDSGQENSVSGAGEKIGEKPRRARSSRKQSGETAEQPEPSAFSPEIAGRAVAGVPEQREAGPEEGLASPETSAEPAAVQKAKRKRPPRKKRPPVGRADAGAAGTGETTAEESEGTVREEAAGADAVPIAPAEEKRAGSRRSRRGRRSKRKEGGDGDTGV